jgi:hypothetical protein
VIGVKDPEPDLEAEFLEIIGTNVILAIQSPLLTD